MPKRMPSLFIPHGGGPCFFMDWNPPHEWDSMAEYLKGIAATLPEKPRAILLISAHWLEDAFTTGGGTAPELIYDYYGFPPHTYELTYPAKGDPALATRVRDLLSGAGLPTADNPARGYDHGVFIPLKVMFPDADIPVVQLSLRSDMAPAAHIAAGEALAPLRDEGVLIIGSGMSFHNLPAMFKRGDFPNIGKHAEAFDNWLTQAVTQSQAVRTKALSHWADAPYARESHPPRGEEHLMPLMVAAGAGGADAGERTFNDWVMGAPVSGYQVG
ncbi:MAG: class III extradiol ring-cleavage dioxygenase [Caulobacterales bacterium]